MPQCRRSRRAMSYCSYWLGVALFSAGPFFRILVLGQSEFPGSTAAANSSVLVNATERETATATISPTIGGILNNNYDNSIENMNEEITSLLFENPWQQATFPANSSSSTASGSGWDAKNGTERISLLLAIPLSYEDQAKLDPGFSQLVSAMMAIDHFNERNPVIVDELNLTSAARGNINNYTWGDIMQDCNLQIDYDSLILMDTGTIENRGMGTIMGNLRKHPHAIAGPYNDIPALELSVIASSLHIPMVAHRGLDHNLLRPKMHPFLTQVNPDLVAEMQFLADYLRHVGRLDYIAVLYSANTDSSLQRLEAFRTIAHHDSNITHIQPFGYTSAGTPRDSITSVRSISLAMEQIKATGYRSIVWLSPFLDNDSIEVGKAATKHGLDQGDHFWVFQGGSEVSVPSTLTPEALSLDIFRYLRGGAYLTTFEWFDSRRFDNNFLRAWKQLDASFAKRVRDILPFTVEEIDSGGWYDFLDKEPNNTTAGQFEKFPPGDLFSNPTDATLPAYGSIYMYDAVMSIALGACHAVKSIQKNSTQFMSGETHQTGIRAVQFSGASGPVSFGGSGAFPGSRTWHQAPFGVFNMFPEGPKSTSVARVTEYYDPVKGEWVSINRFVYADATTSPPSLLRDPANQNYLSEGVRKAGLTLMSTALVAAIVSAVWVVFYRHDALVLASQPPFLCLFCIGCALTASAIIPSSFDESYGWSENQLSNACLSIPWLVIMGHIFCYNALFTKLWRVNRVLSFSRKQIQWYQVMWPAMMVEITAMILLSVWTAYTDYGWKRSVIDETTGESMGQCDGAGKMVLLFLALALCLIPTLLTEIMAWKTIDVDAAFSESKWVFALILVQFQVILVALPLVYILRDVSSNGRYLGVSLILWTLPMTNIGLIILPKVCAVHFPRKETRATRGSTEGVRVSGLPVSSTPTVSQNYYPSQRHSNISSN